MIFLPRNLNGDTKLIGSVDRNYGKLPKLLWRKYDILVRRALLIMLYLYDSFWMKRFLVVGLRGGVLFNGPRDQPIYLSWIPFGGDKKNVCSPAWILSRLRDCPTNKCQQIIFKILCIVREQFKQLLYYYTLNKITLYLFIIKLNFFRFTAQI